MIKEFLLKEGAEWVQPEFSKRKYQLIIKNDVYATLDLNHL